MSQAQKAGNHLRIVRHGTHQARAVPGGNHPFQFQHVVKGVLVQQTVAEDVKPTGGVPTLRLQMEEPVLAQIQQPAHS